MSSHRRTPDAPVRSPAPLPRTWKQHLRVGSVTPSSRPRLAPGASVLTMGSCFALELRRALHARGWRVLPALPPALDEEMIWYTPTSILQEVRLAFDVAPRDPRAVWENVTLPERKRAAQRWQDPYRRFVYAPSAEALARLAAEQDALMRAAFREADAYVFTFGLIEAWRTPGGAWACHEPLPLDPAKAEPVLLDFGTCHAAILEIVATLRRERPAAEIALTVSPVPLKRTYRDDVDVAVANAESKAVLRAAVAQVCRSHPEVHYFPAYELVTQIGPRAFEPDGRHVRRAVVERVLATFLGEAKAASRPAAWALGTLRRAAHRFGPRPAP